MTRDDLVPCLRCFEGVKFERCGACDGRGAAPEGDTSTADGYCDKCGGAGEVAAGKCEQCGGAGHVTFALSRLQEADRWVRAHSPEWEGDNRDRPGITLYSTAEWCRRRLSEPPMRRAYGYLYSGEPHVELHGYGNVDGDHRVAELLFTGFAWGYGGEGPNGLAAVLADAFPRNFETFDDALRWVAHQPFKGSWTLEAAK